MVLIFYSICKDITFSKTDGKNEKNFPKHLSRSGRAMAANKKIPPGFAKGDSMKTNFNA